MIINTISESVNLVGKPVIHISQESLTDRIFVVKINKNSTSNMNRIKGKIFIIEGLLMFIHYQRSASKEIHTLSIF